MGSSLTNWSKVDWGKRKDRLTLQGHRIAGTLSQGFYDRDTMEVAQDLLGKLVVVRSNPALRLEDPEAGVTAGRIVETEAYHGQDPASHSSRGETPRCSVMFGEPGRAYVYFIYGMYEMLNFVTEGKGYPGAVLIRAIEPMHGLELIRQRRMKKTKVSEKDLANGPGRLCRALGIEMKHNRESLLGPSIFVVDDGFRPESVLASSRVGIQLATDRYWRYFIKDNAFVSRVKENALARPVSGPGAGKARGP